MTTDSQQSGLMSAAVERCEDQRRESEREGGREKKKR